MLKRVTAPFVYLTDLYQQKPMTARTTLCTEPVATYLHSHVSSVVLMVMLEIFLKII